MSTVLSLRLRDDQVERLRRAARQLGRRPSEAAAMLLDESLRQREFAFIEFRESPVGRQAYVKGTRLAVHWIVAHVGAYAGDVDALASALGLPPAAVRSSLAYAAAYPDAIRTAMEDTTVSVDDIRCYVPDLQTFEVVATRP